MTPRVVSTVSGEAVARRASKRHAALLFVLTLLFVLRVCGQALQRWYPLQALPPFDAWQGSNAPYPALLSVQLLIVLVMLHVCWRTAHGTNTPNRRIGGWLAGFGALYMTGSVSRIAIGLTVSGAPAWFGAWISAIFHVLLAAFVLTVAHYHLRAQRAHA